MPFIRINDYLMPHSHLYTHACDAGGDVRPGRARAAVAATSEPCVPYRYSMGNLFSFYLLCHGLKARIYGHYATVRPRTLLRYSTSHENSDT
jgi:hypothetical protein